MQYSCIEIVLRLPTATIFNNTSDCVESNFIKFNSLKITIGHCFQLFFIDRKSTRLNSSHLVISYAVFCLKKKTQCRSRPDLLSRIDAAESIGKLVDARCVPALERPLTGQCFSGTLRAVYIGSISYAILL